MNDALSELPLDVEKCLISKGPFCPMRQQVTFQTKITRYYPSADRVPFAGCTSAELNVKKHEKVRYHDHCTPSSQTPLAHVKSKIGIFDDSTVDGTSKNKSIYSITPSSRRHFVDLQNKGCATNLLEDQDLDCSYLKQHNANSSSKVIGHVSRNQRNSCQAQTLLEYQFYNNNDSKLKNNNDELNLMPCNKSKRFFFPKQQIESIQVKKSLEDIDSTNNNNQTDQQRKPEKRVNNVHARFRNNESLTENVFTYGLPSKRSSIYTGCISMENCTTRDIKCRQDCITPCEGFIVPNEHANVIDKIKSGRRLNKIYVNHVGWDMIPLSIPPPHEQQHHVVLTKRRIPLHHQSPNLAAAGTPSSAFDLKPKHKRFENKIKLDSIKDVVESNTASNMSMLPCRRPSPNTITNINFHMM